MNKSTHNASGVSVSISSKFYKKIPDSAANYNNLAQMSFEIG